MSSTLVPTFKSIDRLQLKIQMDSEQTDKFGADGQKVRVYEQKKLSFQGIDLKIGTIVESMSVHHLDKFHNDVTTTG